MNRTQTVARLKSYADAIKALGATSLFLFGSTARNENNSDSDLDLFVDYDPNGKFNALDLVDIKLLLEDKSRARKNARRHGLTSHRSMPNLVLDAQERADIIAFILTLKAN